MALTELAAAVPLDIMPGAGDPANYTLPQQPLHRCMFPGAAAYSTLHRATNPHEFELGGLTFLGTSGQNVDDVFRCVCAYGYWEVFRAACKQFYRISAKHQCTLWPHLPPTLHLPTHRYSDIEDRTAILGKLLQWRHLAPTAPDTLAAYPYHMEDPFIMAATPHVLFAGGQPAFATSLVEGEGGGPATRVVAVPNFATTGCVVLINLGTLACHPVYFDDNL